MTKRSLISLLIVGIIFFTRLSWASESIPDCVTNSMLAAKVETGAVIDVTAVGSDTDFFSNAAKYDDTSILLPIDPSVYNLSGGHFSCSDLGNELYPSDLIIKTLIQPDGTIYVFADSPDEESVLSIFALASKLVYYVNSYTSWTGSTDKNITPGVSVWTDIDYKQNLLSHLASYVVRKLNEKS